GDGIRDFHVTGVQTCALPIYDLAETASISDYLYVVGDGQVLGQGSPDELMNSDNPRIRQFMQGIPDGPVPFHFDAPDYRDDLLEIGRASCRERVEVWGWRGGG